MGFSPDGRYLLYRNTNTNTNWDLWVLPLEGDRTPQPIATSRFQEMMGAFSPDGRWIAYQTNESGQHEIVVQSFPDAKTRVFVSASGGAQPRWRGDSKELYYVGLDSRLMAVSLTVSSSGVMTPASPVALFPLRTPGGPVPIPQKQQYVVAADGQRFLINSLTDEAVASPLSVILNWKGAIAAVKRRQ
jgi:dipeptidyl aminopeptidase/acylaminoacyl peptidase